MRYFVTLDDREHSLKLERAAQAGADLARGGSPRIWAAVDQGAGGAAAPVAGGGVEAAIERELPVEVLAPARHGRPAVVRVDGRIFRVRLEGTAAQRVARVNGHALRLKLESELERKARPAASAARSSGTRIAAPMPGRVVKVNVSVGDVVSAGTALLSVEAMKMENELQAPAAGKVVSVRVQVGATVESDQELIVIAPE
jgi:biotin carboxyl carrier protein